VGKRVDISRADGWKGRRPQTQIVALGAPEGKLGSFLSYFINLGTAEERLSAIYSDVVAINMILDYAAAKTRN
jgi:hypothetical protein